VLVGGEVDDLGDAAVAGAVEQAPEDVQLLAAVPAPSAVTVDDVLVVGGEDQRLGLEVAFCSCRK
jgi:hypothetical protein